MFYSKWSGSVRNNQKDGSCFGCGEQGHFKRIALKAKNEDKFVEVKILEIRNRDSRRGTRSFIVLFIRMKEEGTVTLTHVWI